MDKKIYWIESIKLLALLAIMTFHFWPAVDPTVRDFGIYFKDWTLLKLPLRNGFQGTFLFFTTSGIGLTLLLSKKKITWMEFYRSRLLRIYVPFWVTISAALLLYFLGRNVSLTPPSNPLQWMGNILLLELPRMQKLQPHFWFLFAIIRLYILFPFIYGFARKTGHLGLAGIFILEVFAFTLYGIFPFHYLKTFLTQIFVWIFPFYFGIYVALMLLKDREKTERVLHKLFPLGVVVWGIGTVANNYPKGDPITFTFLPLGVFIIAFKVASLNWKLPAVNNISYEVYLVHITLLALLSPILKPLSTALFYFAFILASLLAAYSVNQVSKAIYDIANLSPQRRDYVVQPDELPAIMELVSTDNYSDSPEKLKTR